LYLYGAKPCTMFKNYFSGLVFLLLSPAMSGQSLITPAGGDFVAADTRIEFSLGELTVATLNSEDYILTQGFHQGSLIASAVDIRSESLFCTLYPNPAREMVNILLNKDHEVLVKVRSMAGQTLMEQVLHERVTGLHVKNLDAGLYLVEVLDLDGRQRALFRLVML